MSSGHRSVLGGLLNALALILLAVCVLAVWKNGR